MASRSADWVRGVVRLTSSARTMWAKIGPATNSNVSSFWLKTLEPVMSDGRRSGVHWMRRNVPPTEVARARASIVLPVPGRSWSRMCPPATSPASARRTTRSLPTITRRMFFSTRSRSSAARRGWSDRSCTWRFSLEPVFAGSAALALADHPRDDLAQVRATLPERHRVDPVREDHLRHLADVLHVDLLVAVVGRLRLRGPRAHEVGSMAVDLQRDRDLRDQAQDLARERDLGEGRDRLRDLRFHRVLRLRVLLIEQVGVVLPDGPLLDDGDALVEVADAFDVDTKAEPVEQLRPELPLLWVHGAHEDEPRRVRHGHALA